LSTSGTTTSCQDPQTLVHPKPVYATHEVVSAV
jgi:hypothetical protein